MKALRLSAILLVALLALAAIGAGGLYWASRSETALRWALAQLGPRIPGTLEVEGITGALIRPIAIARLSYVQKGVRVALHEVELDWSLRALLLERRLVIQRIRAQGVDVTLGAGGDGPLALPASLAPPLPVDIRSLEVARLHVTSSKGTTALGPLRARYSADDQAHVLRVDELVSPAFRGEATLRLGTRQPFELNATFAARAVPDPAWPVAVQGVLRGTLTDLALEAGVQAAAMSVPVRAQLRPLDARPVQRFEATARDVDLARLIDKAPHTRLDVDIEGSGTQDPLLRGTLRAVNRAPGPIDRALLPLREAGARFDFDGTRIVLDGLQLQLGAQGTARGAARLRADALDADLALQDVDLQQLHGRLRRTRLHGSLALAQDAQGRRIDFALAERGIQVRLAATQRKDALTIHDASARMGGSEAQASGKLSLTGDNSFDLAGTISRLNPADFGDFPSARLSGKASASGRLKPQWQAAIHYRIDNGRWRDQPIKGEGSLDAAARRIQSVDATLQVGRNRLRATGALGQPADVLQFNLDLVSLRAFDPAWGGSLRAQGSLGGRFAQPHLRVKMAGQDLTFGDAMTLRKLDATAAVDRAGDPRLSVQAQAGGLRLGATQVDAARLDAQGLLSRHEIRVDAQGPSLDLLARLSGRAAPALDAWDGEVVELVQRGEEAFTLQAPAPLAASRRRIAFGPALVNWSGGRVEIGPTVYGDGRLQSSGVATGFPARKLLQFYAAPPGWTTDLVLGARWQLSAGDSVDGRVEIQRESGDLGVTVDDKRFALGIAQLGAVVTIAGNAVDARIEAHSPTLGRVQVDATTRLALRDGRWGLPGSAPLRVRGDASLKSVRPVTALFSNALRVDGALTASLNGNGTVAAPGLRGTLAGEGIRIEQVGSGVFLRDGVLRAEFVDTGVRLREFSVKAGEGSFSANGDYALRDQTLRLRWRADRLAAVQMPDLLLVASGSGSVVADRTRIELSGTLRADKGRAELREVTTATLGDDVVIVGAKPRQSMPARMAQGRLDLHLDLGDDFNVSGRGLDARIGGKLHVHNDSSGALRADGRIEVRSGTYVAYGRKLDIERGVLLFAGPLANPALDIRAVRKNLQVEAGVEVTGTARKPEARLVSVPDVPDMEKLSWITLGRRNDSASQSDTQALQRYAAALATTLGTGSFQSKAAEALGLDEISISPGMDGSSAGGVIQIGKRLGDRIYLLLEQRLSTAGNVVKVNYQFARDWSLRLESGETDAIDLFYTFSFD